MFLFFYPVDNEQEFDRHFFDGMEPEEAAKILLDLKDKGETVLYYNTENDHPNGRFLNMRDFAENCNDQDIELEYFWTIVLDVSYEKMRELVDGKDWWKTAIYPNEQPPTKNINKYLDNQEQTENGYVYKREDYETAPDNEIVYICEYDLGELQTFCDNGDDLTDEEMIEQGIGDTKATIRRTIKDYYPNATDEWIDKHDLIADIIQSCTWESPATMIDQMGRWDIWDDYPEN